MKTNKNNALSSFDITLPNKWEDLTPNQTVKVFEILAQDLDLNTTYTLLFCALGGVRIERKLSDNHYVISHNKNSGIVSTAEISNVIMHQFTWIVEISGGIGRLPKICGRKAIDATLNGCTFQTYLMLENAYQGYLKTKLPRYVKSMLEHLYPGLNRKSKINPSEFYSVVYWWASLKVHFANAFPHLFRAVDATQAKAEDSNARQAMNIQIKILSGGDITKEEDVLASSCWRALTNLDDKAKEASEQRSKAASE